MDLKYKKLTPNWHDGRATTSQWPPVVLQQELMGGKSGSRLFQVSGKLKV